ncbi:MAG: hypothetical protein FWF03_07715, partial [Defluviitaleaceae bacterium]|nr:hypothetical protein [Defluviitaleaceae bacterium]
YGEADGNAAFELLNASGDGPDIFLAKTDPSRICKWITDRAIRGLPEAILDDYPALSASLSGEGILRAYALLYGDRVWFIPKTYDREPQYSADGARIFYRKDLPSRLGLAAPESVVGLRDLARSYEKEAGLPFGIAADSAKYFFYMYGLDPDQWINEDGRYVPVYYSGEAMAPLAFARSLHEEGLLTFIGPEDEITLCEAGVLMTCGGTPEAFEDALIPVANAQGVTVREALEQCVGVMDPPQSAGRAAVWGRSRASECWVFNYRIRESAMRGALSLFEYSLSDEARAYARYGLPGITYDSSPNGFYFFTDPETFGPYDIKSKYPSASFLLGMATYDFSRCKDINLPSTIAPGVRLSCAASYLRYRLPSDTQGGLVCLATDAPLRDAFELDNETLFKQIATGSDPFDETFERYREFCRSQGIEEMIEEVNRVFR